MSAKRDQTVTRRQFVKGALAGLTILPLANVRTLANPADAPLVSEDDPVAIALGYKHDATQVDTDKFPKRAGKDGATQLCSNCALYTADGESAGACSLFPGKQVKAAGWCNSWLKQPS